jgi:hypothetical protein
MRQVNIATASEQEIVDAVLANIREQGEPGAVSMGRTCSYETKSSASGKTVMCGIGSILSAEDRGYLLRNNIGDIDGAGRLRVAAHFGVGTWRLSFLSRVQVAHDRASAKEFEVSKTNSEFMREFELNMCALCDDCELVYTPPAN